MPNFCVTLLATLQHFWNFFFKTVFIFSRVRSPQYLLQVAWRSSRDVINGVVYMSAFRIFLCVTLWYGTLTRLKIGVHVHYYNMYIYFHTNDLLLNYFSFYPYSLVFNWKCIVVLSQLFRWTVYPIGLGTTNLYFVGAGIHFFRKIFFIIM